MFSPPGYLLNEKTQKIKFSFLQHKRNSRLNRATSGTIKTIARWESKFIKSLSHDLKTPESEYFLCQRLQFARNPPIQSKNTAFIA